MELTLIERIVWDEFVQAKSWEQYISDYTGHKMDIRKWLGITIGLLAIAGSAAWGVWKLLTYTWVTPVILLIVGASQLLTSLSTHVIVDSETLKFLAKLRGMYIEYSNKLECLVLKILNKDISQEEIEEQYFSLRETVYPIEELKDSLNIHQLKRLSKKVEDRIELIMKDRYKI